MAEVRLAYLFGSIARGAARPSSDLDIAVLLVTPGEPGHAEPDHRRARSLLRPSRRPRRSLAGAAPSGTRNPLEVYALHCCRELAELEDPRAPGELSVQAGLAILPSSLQLDSPGAIQYAAAPMVELFLTAAERVDAVLWGPWTMIFIACVSVYLTARSGLFQIRGFFYILRHTLGKLRFGKRDGSKSQMTPFQATATALASTVGTGNIAGVATALSVGGPGAIFWMWLLAIFGMMSKTVEITLAVHYRDVEPDGRTHGGPMYYIRKGLGWSSLAKLFSIGILVNSMVAATLQSHTVGRAFLSTYAINPYIVTGLMAIVTAIVVIGGVRRIGQFSEALVPLMSAVFILSGLGVFLFNYEHIPEVFALIFRHAFSPAPALGGFSGAAVSQAIRVGMSRGMLSNEAGLGTAPMAHATASTEHPFQQGMWGAFEVAIDTLVICSISAFAVLSTGVLSSGESGIELVIGAFSSVFLPGIAGGLLSFAILTFCLTTQIAFFVYFETAVTSLLGPRAIYYLRWVYLVPGVLFAGVANVDRLWVFANLAVGSCALPNLIAVLALSGPFFVLMRDYVNGKNRYATAVTDVSREYVK